MSLDVFTPNALARLRSRGGTVRKPCSVKPSTLVIGAKVAWRLAAHLQPRSGVSSQPGNEAISGLSDGMEWNKPACQIIRLRQSRLGDGKSLHASCLLDNAR
ncbi:hypothetical protein CHARACLAT_029896 [Characodon lateralis]|uniref:Uncharacterized protein n=1 Tax=Characodon lateralis TaxID=208331 RepID=A0ABU7DBJ5_9TELE|nr:hypothetical protein [Characodon lateralis]